MDIKKQLKKVTKELLSEEALNEIQASFEAAVEEKAKVQVASALVKQDTDYANKLSHLLEAIDEALPKAQIQEAVSNRRAQVVLEQIK